MSDDCYSCAHWHLFDPNRGGLIDIGYCEVHCKDTAEEHACSHFVKQNKEQREAQVVIRNKLFEVLRECTKEMEENVKRERFRVEKEVLRRFDKLFFNNDDDDF